MQRLLVTRDIIGAAYDDTHCYISMKRFVVSISSHPKTPLLKRLTRSMQMFSGTWTRLYQKEVTTFPQGQHFMNQNLDFLSH